MSDSKKAYKNWKVQQGSDIIFPNQVWQAACDWKASAQDGVSSSADCILVPRSLIERWANVDAFNVPRGAAMELKVAAQMMLSTQQQPSAVVPDEPTRSMCECSIAITPLGDGCRYCKPQEWIDLLNEWLDEHRARVAELESALQDAVDREQDPLN
jgi:hypothetical protein